MALSPELYERFIKGECTEEEEQLVLQYFSRDPDAMDAYLQLKDWEAFRPAGKLHPAVSQKVLENINDRIERNHARRRMWRRSWAAAAALAGMIVSGWLMTRLPSRQHNSPQIAVQAPADTLIYIQQHNNGKTVMALLLEDSSRVRLFPGSYIRYRKGFDSSKREIWLKGMARFDVAKDSRRPFTVYAANTATTALGTAFRIREDSARHQVSVKLYSGKVVVRPYNSGFKETYLQPGEELVYDHHSRIAIPVIHREQRKETPAAAGSSLVYRQLPLPEVLRRLEAHFNIQVAYNAKSLQRIKVTAEFTEADSPEDILQTIALLNGLTLEQTATGGYLLRK